MDLTVRTARGHQCLACFWRREDDDDEPCLVVVPMVTSYDSMTSWIASPMSQSRTSIPAS